MSDPLSVSAGLVALVTFGLQATTSLLEVIHEFKRAPNAIRQLRAELQALCNVLRELQSTANSDSTDFAMLELPLQQCCKACRDFQEMLARCAGRTAGARANFQDWAKLRWHSSDINGFKDTIAVYKSTISIALCSVNLRTSRVTLEVFEEYKEMIKNTTYDLNSRLQDVDEKLQIILLRGEGSVQKETGSCEDMQEEKESILKCLEICHHVSSGVEALQSNIGTRESHELRSVGISSNLPASALFVAADSLVGYGNKLEANLRKLKEQLKNRASPSNPAPTSRAEEEELVQEIEGIQQSIEFLGRASKEAESNRSNVLEDISSRDDARQVIASTIGYLIFAKGVRTGSRSTQVLGQMSDESLRHIIPSGKGTAATQTQEPGVPEGQFTERYGTGRNLHNETRKNHDMGIPE